MKKMKTAVLILMFLSISFLPVILAPAPTATTLSATSITQTSAVLRGKVNPNGLSTKVDFCSCDPSASPTYFSPSPLQNIGSGNADVTVTYTLSGLTPGTTYSYCVRSVNSAGSQNGACVNFTTSSGGAPSATLTTNKANYAPGETVQFTLTNTGSVAINGTLNNPWTIFKKSGALWQIAYVPGVAMQNWTLNPGDSKSWSWGQTSNAMVTIDAATYKVEVVLVGVGTWSATFTIGDGGGDGGGEPAEDDDDGDGVPNSQDSCYNPDCNLVDPNGCPRDTDGDGLNDCEDDCPAERGLAANDGCPPGDEGEDRDGDGVADDRDACYNPECSIVDTQGCPKDSDDDGLDDCEDECPSEYGERRNDGCPEEDADSDGIPDSEDSCYNPGCNRVDSIGCPLDSDGDGSNDCEDNCPNQSGPASNNGCPQQPFCSGSVVLCVFLLLGLLMRT